MNTFKFFQCRACKISFDSRDEALAHEQAGGYRTNIFGEQRANHRAVAMEVRGVKREDIKCGGRCLVATGPDCECQCGGEHHGRYAA